MPSPYLPNLIQIAQQDIPSLQYDIQHASTLFTQQAVLQKMHNIMAFLVHHVILEGTSALPVPPAAPIRPVMPVAQPLSQPVPVGVAPPTDHHPHLQPMSHPIPTPGLLPGTTPSVPSSQVAQVIITPQGTRVIPPGAPESAAVSVPSGSHVDLVAMQRAAAGEPVSGDVVLPAGGAMTPEVLAALGQARNITQEPAAAP